MVVSAEKTSTLEPPGGSDLAIDRSSAGSDALTWSGSLQGRELRSPARRPFQRQPHHGARTSRSQRCPSAPDGPKLSAKDVARAADLYRDGLSLAAIGHGFGVNASTVGKALRRADVQIRPRRGWASA